MKLDRTAQWPPARDAALFVLDWRRRTMRKIVKLFLDAYWRFNAQDGWAIASHIALSALTSLFPFLIFVTAMAGFVGSQSLADEVAKLVFSAWPPSSPNRSPASCTMCWSRRAADCSLSA